MLYNTHYAPPKTQMHTDHSALIEQPRIKPGIMPHRTQRAIASMRMFLRYVCASLGASAVDMLTFMFAQWMGFSLGHGFVVSRSTSVCYSFFAAKYLVFQSQRPTQVLAKAYLLLVAFSGFSAWQVTLWLCKHDGLHPLTAKIIAESILFAINYIVQLKYIFTHADRN